MRVQPGVAILLFAALTLSACQPAVERTEADAVALHRLVGEWTAAFNAADVGALTALYTDNAVWMDADSPARKGHPAIRDSFTQLFERGTFVSEDLVDEVIVSQDLRIARLTWREEFTPKDGDDPLREVGKAMWLIQRQPDGTWKIKWGIWNRDAPALYPG